MDANNRVQSFFRGQEGSDVAGTRDTLLTCQKKKKNTYVQKNIFVRDCNVNIFFREKGV